MPTGSAISTYPSSSFSLITPTVLSYFILWYIYSVANIFLVILSSYIPLFVSSTAILASSIWCSNPAIDICFTILSTCSWVKSIYSSEAILAFSTSLSIISFILCFSSSVTSTAIFSSSFLAKILLYNYLHLLIIIY